MGWKTKEGGVGKDNYISDICYLFLQKAAVGHTAPGKVETGTGGVIGESGREVERK